MRYDCHIGTMIPMSTAIEEQGKASRLAGKSVGVSLTAHPGMMQVSVRELEYRQGTSDKFWRGFTGASAGLVHWGRRGSKGQTKRQSARDVEGRVWEKRAKGYKLTCEHMFYAEPSFWTRNAAEIDNIYNEALRLELQGATHAPSAIVVLAGWAAQRGAHGWLDVCEKHGFYHRSSDRFVALWEGATTLTRRYPGVCASSTAAQDRVGERFDEALAHTIAAIWDPAGEGPMRDLSLVVDTALAI